MAIESKDLLVALKAFSRANPLPLDASSVHDTYAAAESYCAKPTSYVGQIITAKDDSGNYKAYIIQNADGGGKVLVDLATASGGTPAPQKTYVVVGPLPALDAAAEGVIYIDEQNVGHIFNGAAFVKIFEDVSSTITDIQNALGDFAPIDSPDFTTTASIGGKEIATKEYVDSEIGQLNNGVPTAVNTTSGLPLAANNAGQMWRVIEAGEYAGQNCEIGDLIIALTNNATQPSDFMVIQANIDGAITGPATAVDGNLVAFDGATGNVVKDSGITMTGVADAVAKKHEHTNLDALNTYDVSKTDLLAAAATEAQGKVDTLNGTMLAALNAKANSSDVYTKGAIDTTVTALTTAINAKTTMGEVETKIGDLGTANSVVEYVDGKVGEIDLTGYATEEYADTAEADAIAAAKAYTDSCLAIVEF